MFRENGHSLRRDVEFRKVAVREQEVREWHVVSLGGQKKHHEHGGHQLEFMTVFKQASCELQRDWGQL